MLNKQKKLLQNAHFLDHFLQIIFGSGSPEALQVNLTSSAPTAVVTFSSSCTLGLIMTLSEAVVSIIPALFSALHVYWPASRLVTVNIVMVPVCSSTFTPDIVRDVNQIIRN